MNKDIWAAVFESNGSLSVTLFKYKGLKKGLINGRAWDRIFKALEIKGFDEDEDNLTLIPPEELNMGNILVIN